MTRREALENAILSVEIEIESVKISKVLPQEILEDLQKTRAVLQEMLTEEYNKNC